MAQGDLGNVRFTILTQYYPPETGAPQNRLHSLARNLLAAGHEVEALTAMPNYPKQRVFDAYRGKFKCEEELDGVRVCRSWIFVGKHKGMWARLLTYFSFVCSSLFVGLGRGRSDYLICESPPLFLGLSAVAIAKKQRARLIFNVSDLWPESAVKLGIVGEGTALRIVYKLEAWIYEKSFLVTGQTQGIVADIAARFPEVPTLWLPNGVDIDVVSRVRADSSWRKRHNLEGKRVFMYAGILGHAQGLEVMVKAAADLKSAEDIAFVIVGDGPVAEELRKLNDELGGSVIFLPGVSKGEIMSMIADVYACIVVLKKLELFKGAIPSKIFDPLSLGVPILLGVEGEAKELFIDEAKAGFGFEPENSLELVKCVEAIVDDPDARGKMGRRGKAFVYEHFDRRAIARKLLHQLQMH
jgi:glycosyltransferase involved in cell wall biosynthesis